MSNMVPTHSIKTKERKSYVTPEGIKMVWVRSKKGYRPDKRIKQSAGVKLPEPGVVIPPPPPSVPSVEVKRDVVEVKAVTPPDPRVSGLYVRIAPGGKIAMVEFEEKPITVVINGQFIKSKTINTEFKLNMFRCTACGLINNEKTPGQTVCSICA